MHAQQHSGIDQHFAENRELQVNAPGLTGRWAAQMHHQPVGAEAHQSEPDIEAGCILSDHQQQIAGQREQPEQPEAAQMSAVAQVGDRKAAGAGPQHRTEAQPRTRQQVIGAPTGAGPEQRQFQRWRRPDAQQ